MNYKKLTNGFVRSRVKDEFLKSETVQETVAKLKGMCPNYDEIIENNYSGEKSYIPTLSEVVREARTGDTVAQRCLAEIKRCGNVSDSCRVKDSRRVKDNVTHEMYMCDVWVSFDEMDKEDIYNDSYISKSNGQRYTSEDYTNGDELDLEGEFQPTFDDAFDEAIQLCYKLAEKFPNDPYIINIDKFDVDDETGDVDNADSYATYNAWFNEHTGKIMWVG